MVILASVWASPDKDTLIAKTMNTIMKVINSLPPSPEVPGHFNLSDENSLRNSFMKSGFKALSVERVNVTFDFDSPEAFTAFTSGNFWFSSKILAKQTNERRTEILKAVTEAGNVF